MVWRQRTFVIPNHTAAALMGPAAYIDSDWTGFFWGGVEEGSVIACSLTPRMAERVFVKET
jgi:hypothetical protein